jgi:serine/threonine protein kinase/Tfp pilus assembly protein PilF
MSIDAIIRDLLVRWLSAPSLTAEELCRGHKGRPEYPAILEAVRQARPGALAEEDLIDTKKKLDSVAQPTPPPGTPADDAKAPPETWRGDPAEAPLASGTHSPPQVRYRLLSFHAAGGLGEVFRAHDSELHREVALKRIKKKRDGADSRRSFLREAEITAKLEHPGVVPVHGLIADEDGQPCYAMRFIEGRTLKDAIDEFHAADQKPNRDPGERSLALRRLLGQFIAVCNTIGYAHSRGILHRDLKPDNIMLGKYGETLVVDWGLAKPFERTETERKSGEETLQPLADIGPGSETRAGEAKGTPAYMSPEQANGHWDALSPASDIFCLGATLYALVTGNPPYPGDQLKSLQRARRAEFQPPRQAKKDVPRALEAVCLKAMALKPEDRYDTALDVAADLEQWLADEPVAAYPEPWHARCWRWIRRHQTLVASASVAALLLVAAGIGAFMLWESAETKRKQTAEQAELQRKQDAEQAELRQQQAVEARRLDLLRSAEASESLGVAELQQGRYESAAGVFQQALERLGDEPTLAEARKRIEARRDQARRLTDFYHLSRRAERLMTHDLDREARADFEAALDILHARPNENWWEKLPSADLPPKQLERLKRDVHLHWLLLAGIRARTGLVYSGDADEAQRGYESGLEAAAAAQRYKPSYAGQLVSFFCRYNLGRVDPTDLLLAGSQPRLSIDFYLIGILNFWVKYLPDDPISRQALEIADKMSILDLKDPLATAERHLRTATSLDPDHYWSYYWLGEVLEARNKLSEAELAYGICIGLRPDYYDGFLKRGYTVLEQYQRTANNLERQRLFSRAMNDFDAAVRIASTDFYPVGVRGLAHATAGDYDKAIADYTRAIALPPKPAGSNPHFYLAYSMRGYAQYALRRYDLAIADYTEALKLFPRRIKSARWNIDELYNARGNACHAKADYKAAIADYDQAIGVRPLAVYYSNRGNSRLLKGDPAGAVKDCTEAINIDSKMFIAYWTRAAAHAERNDLTNTTADLLKASQLNRYNADVWARLAHVALRQKDDKAYRDACQSMMANLGKTNDAPTADQVAWVCSLCPGPGPDPAQVVKLAQLAEKNHIWGSQRTLGAALYRAGKHADALKHLTDADKAKAADRPALTWLFLAMVCQRLDKPDEARGWLNKADKWIEQADQAKPGTTGALTWFQRTELDSLAREAKGLVRKTTP